MSKTDEIIEHLLHVRGALDAICEDVRELKRPLGGLENRYQGLSDQLDRIDSRIERIERRLDLTDA